MLWKLKSPCDNSTCSLGEYLPTDLLSNFGKFNEVMQPETEFDIFDPS